jgi:hypothetical protein
MPTVEPIQVVQKLGRDLEAAADQLSKDIAVELQKLHGQWTTAQTQDAEDESPASPASPAAPTRPSASGGDRWGVNPPWEGGSDKPKSSTSRPWWRGVRGIGRWLWKGQSPDNPDYAHLYPDLYPSGYHPSMEPQKEHLSLHEYNELSDLIDDLTNQIVEATAGEPEVQIPEEDGLQFVKAVDNFKNRVRWLVMRARRELGDAKAANTEEVPEPVVNVSPKRGAPPPDDIDPDAYAAGMAATPTATEPEGSEETKPSDDAVIAGLAQNQYKKQLLGQDQFDIQEPQPDWASLKGTFLRALKLHPALRWLIKEGINIFDEGAVQQALSGPVNSKVKGNVLSQFFKVLRLGPIGNEEKRDQQEAVLRRLGWNKGIPKMAPQPAGVQDIDDTEEKEEKKPKPMPEKLGKEGDELPDSAADGGDEGMSADDWIRGLMDMPDEDIEKADDPREQWKQLGFNDEDENEKEDEKVPEEPVPEEEPVSKKPVLPKEPEKPEPKGGQQLNLFGDEEDVPKEPTTPSNTPEDVPDVEEPEEEEPSGNATADELEGKVRKTVSKLSPTNQEKFEKVLDELKAKLKDDGDYQAHMQELAHLLQMVKKQDALDNGDVDDLMAHYSPGELLRNEELLRKVETKKMTPDGLREYYLNCIRG